MEHPVDDNTRRVHEVQLLFRLLPTTQSIDFAVVAVIFGLLMKYVSISALLCWTVLVLVILYLRINIAEKHKETVVSEHNVDTWLNLFQVGATLYGAMWSLTAILLVPSDIATFAAFTALILCGLAAAEAALSSVNLRSFTIYVIATLWPYSFFLITTNQYPQIFIGATAFLFSFIVFIMGAHTHKFFTQMIDMEIKNNSLYNELIYETNKRNRAENALLDSTLDEELAELIREQSIKLKLDVTQNEPAEHIKILDKKIQHQLENTLTFVQELGQEKIPESLGRNIKIIEKLLVNINTSIKKATMDSEQVKQELLEIDFEQNESSQINIRRTLNYIMDAIPLIYKAKYIAINKDIDNDIPDKVYGNKDALIKILLNLLTNAIKFSDGGAVNITVKTVSDTNENLILKFSVTDNGIGMQKEVIDFLKNEVDDDESIVMYHGLTVVKYLISKYAVNLSINTTSGAGTTIAFQMPFNTAKKAAA
jgi:signal transduction histidine kinase